MTTPVDISPEHIEKMAACTPFITPEAGAAETAAALRALRSALTASDARIADLEERMTRARTILTNGTPTPDCNWGLLDVSQGNANG